MSSVAAVRPRAAAAAVARMAAWRAHAYGGVGELRLDEARVPPLRAPDELLVRVHAASINPLDVAMLGGYGRRGMQALRAAEAARGGSGAGATGDLELPLTVGRDFVGEVARAGAEARFGTGTRVWGVVPPHWPGAHAQYVVVKDRWVGEAPKAGSLRDSLAAGGALYAALTACSALRVAGLAPGRADEGRGARRRVLLLGLGGVGHAALQLLARGPSDVVVGCSRELAAVAGAEGAAVVLDRHAPDYDERLQAEGPYEVIFDCAGLGGDEASARNRRWRFSRFVTLTTPLLRRMDELGAALGGVAAAAELARQCAAAAASQGVGVATGAFPPPHVRWALFLPLPDDIEMLRRLAERDEFGVNVAHTYGWQAASEAFARAAAGHARGKLLLDFTAASTPEPQPAPATNTAPGPA